MMLLKDLKEIVNRIKFLDRKINVIAVYNGFLLQISYMEDDIDTPQSKAVEQFARKWYISEDASETEIVETVFAACLRSMEHVTREHFTYKNHRVFSRHFHINSRLAICVNNMFDGWTDDDVL